MRIFIEDMPEEKRVQKEKSLSRQLYGMGAIVFIFASWAINLFIQIGARL